MKKIIFPFILLLTSVSACAQKTPYVSPESLFLKDSTYVILEDDPASEYNKVFKVAFLKCWTITKYRFITETALKEKYGPSCQHFFVGKISLEYEYSNSFDDDTYFNVRAFTYENDKKNKPVIKKVGYTPTDMYIKAMLKHPIYGKKTRTHQLDEADYMFIIGYIQNSIQQSKTYPWPTYHFMGDERDKAANAIIHSKTFVITQQELDNYGISEEKFKKQYGGNCKIVSKEELEKYILDKDPGIVYFRIEAYSFTEDGVEKKEKNVGDHIVVVDAATGFVFYEMGVSNIQMMTFFKRTVGN